VLIVMASESLVFIRGRFREIRVHPRLNDHDASTAEAGYAAKVTRTLRKELAPHDHS